MITINFTLVVQCFNFILTLYMLNILLIRPIRGILQERRNKVLELESSITTFTNLAEGHLAKYEAVLAKAREDALGIRGNTKQVALVVAQKIVHDAELSARKALESTHVRVAKEVKEAYKALQEDMQAFVNLVVKKVL